MVRILKIAFAVLVLGYVSIGVLLYFLQDSLIFIPTRFSSAEMESLAKGVGFEPWMNAKSEHIGWQSIEGNPDEVILVFNGQGGTAINESFIRECCRRSPGNWKTFLLEYPGYGSREGRPSEKSFVAAGVEAIDTLAATPGRKIWLAGQSLGSGTACATVRERPGQISGLVLLTPFNSLTAAARFRSIEDAVRIRQKYRPLPRAGCDLYFGQGHHHPARPGSKTL